MRKAQVDYSEEIRNRYRFENKDISLCRNVTFVVTENCNFRCKYCYESCKSGKYMTFDTAKKIVDLVFKMSETNESTFISTRTKAVILEFIGGEPLLNIDVIEKTCDYFWKKALELHHRFADTFRISMISNGELYFDERVQRFIKKYKSRLSFGITIDGDKEMHDACRVRPDGSGTWEQANKAQMHYHDNFDRRLGTKVTIAPSNIEYLDRTIKYFVDNGYKDIHANPVFEEEWTVEQARLYYKKLLNIADYIIDNNLQDEIYCSLFNKNHFKKISDEEQHPYCGGTGDMCAFGTDGTAYPCIRYMNMSLNGSQPEIAIGNCDRGIYQTEDEKDILRRMAAVTRRSSNDDECYNCPIASGCGNCSAWCYQKYGTYNKKDKGICWMHRARCLANDYFFKNIGEPFDMNMRQEHLDIILNNREKI
jgi:radical SAM peptide maturase (CXXX-repeat target family)